MEENIFSFNSVSVLSCQRFYQNVKMIIENHHSVRGFIPSLKNNFALRSAKPKI